MRTQIQAIDYNRPADDLKWDEQVELELTLESQGLDELDARNAIRELKVYCIDHFRSIADLKELVNYGCTIKRIAQLCK